MKEFDYVIIGGGCAGLSLAYELEVHKKLENKTLAIIEPRNEYKRDKTWSFWKVLDHNFEESSWLGLVQQDIVPLLETYINSIPPYVLV